MWEAFLQALFPYRCLICRSECDDYLCAACNANRLALPPRCPHCNRRSSGSACPRCQHTPALEALWVEYQYAGVVKTVIRRAKFQQNPAALALLQRWIAEKALPLPPETVVVPLPISLRRLVQRGFNQSEMLAQSLAQKWDLPLQKRFLHRHYRLPQAQILGTQKRFENIRDAFYLTAAPPPAVLLVDDVYTSGATLSEAARLLRQNGCRYVAARVVAAT